jgi:hypothetical protein
VDTADVDDMGSTTELASETEAPAEEVTEGLAAVLAPATGAPAEVEEEARV